MNEKPLPFEGVLSTQYFGYYSLETRNSAIVRQHALAVITALVKVLVPRNHPES
jgi:hypothetical protein